jgi:heptosyltransferase-1
MRILVVRLRQIGDVVFTTPALTALRAHYPDAFISYLVEPVAAAVLQGNPNIEELVVAPRRRGLTGLRAEWALVRRLRAERFDLVLDFHGGPRASLLTWLSGAPRRIGYEVVGRAWMYTSRITRARELRPRHSVENQWDLLTSLGIGAPNPVSYPVAMPVDPTAAQSVGRRLSAAGAPAGTRLIVMHVSAGNPFRRWPIPAFAEVATQLAGDDPSHRVLVTSGPSERDAAAEVIDASRSRLGPDASARVLACGEFSLAELRALVERAALFIGGDSGPMHIAATSAVPIVGLYGPTLPVRSQPWRSPNVPAVVVEVTGLPCRPCEQRVCVPGDFRCLTGIQPEQVVEASRLILGRTRS